MSKEHSSCFCGHCDIPNVCRSARIIRGETQVLSAIRYKVDPGTISRWENGKSHPPPRVFREFYEIVIGKDPHRIKKYIESSPIPRYVNSFDNIIDVQAISKGLLDVAGVSYAEYLANIDYYIGIATGHVWQQIIQRKDFKTGMIYDSQYRDEAHGGWWSMRTIIMRDTRVASWEGVFSLTPLEEKIELIV